VLKRLLGQGLKDEYDPLAGARRSSLVGVRRFSIVHLTLPEQSLRRPRGMRPATRDSARCSGGNRKERAMKLNSAQLERPLGQFEARPIPDDHPLIPQLNDLFGEHTFFLDRRGLNIVEPVEAAGVSGMVVNLASWSDDSESGLEVHEPEATDVVITLEL